MREDRWDDHDWTPSGTLATKAGDPFDQFHAEGLISEVVRPIKSGKEASVYLCRAGGQAPLGTSLIAVKAYRTRDERSFKSDGVYRAGVVIKSRRVRVAMEKKTKFGRAVGDELWLFREFETLKLLHGIGADVPRPLAMSESSSLAMEYVGYHRPDDRLVIRGMAESDSWIAFYVRDDQVRAAIGINRSDDVELARRMIEEKVAVTSNALEDEDIDLNSCFGEKRKIA